MKQFNWILGSLVPVILLFSFVNVFSQDSTSTLKVMTYNIWNGFDWGKETKRKNNCIQWIKDKNPDVLALQELCGYTKEMLKNDALKWGHSYATILKTDGYPVGITSKKPIILKERIVDSLWHGALHCESFGINFYVVHLSPADVNFRHKEAKILTQKIKIGDVKPFIILGDFNAHSPFDDEALKLNNSLLKKYKKSTSNGNYSNLRLGEFDYSVLSQFLALPSIDITAQLTPIETRFSYPTPALIGTWQSLEQVEKNKERIDYILASPGLAQTCNMVKIYNDEQTALLSDHYPIMAEFNLTSNKN